MSCLEEKVNLLQRLSLAGVSREQIEIGGLLTRESYLATYSDIDIMLDTFPYPGGTTTCEALWMGVPTLTLSGNTLLGRQGASLLNCVGLQDWIAQDEEEYITKAIQHSANIALLSALRENLRTQILETALFDASRFAKQFEGAMFGMWEQTLSEESVDLSC